MNEPDDTPVKSCTGCSWQTVPSGQCISTNDQSNADTGSVPSSGSVAFAEKSMVSPTFHVVDGDGDVIVTVGARLPDEMTTCAVSDAPNGSVTRTLAVCRAVSLNVYCAVGPVASSNEPSPSRSHAYVNGSPSESVDALASKCTVNGTAPDVASL